MPQRKYEVPATARKGLAQFVRKLVELIENSPQDTIKWTRDGRAFLVIDPKRFSKRDLGQWFRSSQFNSFVRQLNFYNFTKVPDSKFNWEFTHPHLRRGDWDSLSLIKRKTSNEFHAVYDKEVKQLRKTVGQMEGTVADLQGRLADALARISTLEAQRDAAVARSCLIYEEARQRGVELDVKLTEMPAEHPFPVLAHNPRKLKRRRTHHLTTPTLVDDTKVGALANTGTGAAAGAARPAPVPALMTPAPTPLKATRSTSGGATPAGSPPSPTVVHTPHPAAADDVGMFLLPGDPIALGASTATLFDSDMPLFDDHAFPSLVGASAPSVDQWLELDAPTLSSSKPPALTRGFSGLSVGSTATVDAYNAFCAAPTAQPTASAPVAPQPFTIRAAA